MASAARSAASAALLVALLSGCAGPTAPSIPAGPATDAASPTTSLEPGGQAITLSGSVRALEAGFSANVSAGNGGPATVQRLQGCGNSWSATLSGPPGEDLDYATPGRHTLSCTSSLAPLPPGGNDTWAFPGRDAGQCTAAGLCDNVWDGELAGDGGTRAPAPPGRYTWTFRFTWQVDGQEGSRSIALPVDVA